MKKLVMLAAVAAAVAGCQTRITAEKYPEQVVPIQRVATVDGQEQVVTVQAITASGGWRATARSPLWADETLDGLNIGVAANGDISLSVDKYKRDLSTNSVTMVHEMFDGGAKLATAIGEAYVKIAGAGAQAETALKASKTIYSAFTGGGGDPSKATVTTEDGKLVVSDGTICTTCTDDGVCTTGACSP